MILGTRFSARVLPPVWPHTCLTKRGHEGESGSHSALTGEPTTRGLWVAPIPTSSTSFWRVCWRSVGPVRVTRSSSSGMSSWSTIRSICSTSRTSAAAFCTSGPGRGGATGGLSALGLRRVAHPELSADVLHELDQAHRSLFSLGRVSDRPPTGDRRVGSATL
jgi:hypothetical protein